MPEYKKIYVVPNQKIIVTKKTNSGTENVYSRDNVDAMLFAAKRLSDRAYKLYTSMNLHQDGYTYGLSATDIRNRIGFSDKKYRQAVSELIEAGYMVKNHDKENEFSFYEAPYIDSPDRAKWEGAPSQTGGASPKNGIVPPPKWEVPPSQNGIVPPPKWGGEILQDNKDNKILQDNSCTGIEDFEKMLKEVKDSYRI